MSNEFRPHPYQSYCIKRIEAEPYAGLFLDMGLGKTVITLTAINELRYFMFRVRRVLIIAPKMVAQATWTAEQAKWPHLSRLRISVVLGSRQERVAALRRDADVYVINRDNVVWLCEYYGHAWPFDMVVLDESSSFKNPQAKRFKALRAMRPRISRLVLLTGTPAPKSLADLWAQIYLLDGGKRLGRTLGAYRDAFFVPGRRNQTVIFEYLPKEGAEEQIYGLIDDICASMKSEDYLQLPDFVVDDIPVELDQAAAKKYKDLERDAILELEDGEAVTAMSAAALTGKLLQLCNGAVYDEEGRAVVLHDCKIDALLETLEQLGEQHALIYYYFQHDLARLVPALQKTKKTVRVYHTAQDIDDWNAGRIDYLLAQPASCGYGLNLQYGGRHIIWFGLTWSLEEYLQANKRLHRQGQPYPVICHRLVVRGGMDEAVIKSLEKKDLSQEALLEAIKAKVEEIRGKA